MIDRRQLLKSTVASIAALLGAGKMTGGSRPARAANGFDHSRVLNAARERAARPFEPRPRPEPMQEISYDIHRNIRFQADEALWRGTGSRFEVQMFHPGRFFPEPLEINTVEDNQVDPVPYSTDHYAFDGPAAAMRDRMSAVEDAGHAGLRIHYPLNNGDGLDEVIAFLGASYFRGLGRGTQYGLSARGIALGTGGSAPEEFPAFVRFWLERPTDGADTIRLHALLDGPSLTGAYRFSLAPGRITDLDIEATLFPRRELTGIGIAPLTSMYLFGPLDPPRFHDYRPRVHDSQGLSLHLNAGERLWRPLVNPESVSISAFQAERLSGFGLTQRNRDFAAYQDLGAHYHLRTGAWIEPAENWGPGALHLVELPAEDETVDNIVAYWQPEQPLAAGSETTWRYRLSWGLDPEPGASVSTTIESRSSMGGIPGTDRHGTGTKFVIDFTATPNSGAIDADDVTANVSASSGEIVNPVAHRNEESGGWRLFFDIVPDGDTPIELRCFLDHPDGPLSETWTYRWSP